MSLDEPETIRRNRLRIAGVGLIAGLAVIVAVLLTTRSSVSGQRLERLKASLRAKGEKLTYAELMGTNQPTSGVAFAQIGTTVRSLNGGRVTLGGIRLQKLVRPGFAQPACLETDDELVNSTTSLGKMTWLEFCAAAKTNESGLATLRRLLENPPADSGTVITNLLAGSRFDFVGIRMGADWLAALAVAEMRAGETEEATKVLEALCALVRVNRAEYLLVSQMVRVYVARQAIAATWELLQAHRWNDAQLARIAGCWEQLDFLEAVESAFLGERALQEELWRMLSHSPRQVAALMGLSGRTGWRSMDQLFGEYVMMPAYRMVARDEDQLFLLQTMQGVLESIRMLRRRLPWTDADRAQGQLWTALTSKTKSFAQYKYSFSLMAMPNFRRAVLTAVHTETERQMLLAAIALERYRLQHGGMPDSLSELIPEFLREGPWDFMAGAPLHYRRLENDDFLLYSTGDDGKDDGGDPTPIGGTTGSIWDGRDAVWLRASKRDDLAKPAE